MASEYVSYGHIEQQRFNRYFKFTFVRNSWARLVSEYKFKGLHRRMSFRDFVLNGLLPKSPYTDAYRHIEPQYNFLHDKSGVLLVDFVGKFESLQEGFDHVCSKINIQESKLPHINSSNNSPTIIEKIKKLWSFKKQDKPRHYTEYYDNDTLAIVSDLYAKDIATFGYVFGE
ncbi:sulfotransferase family 2 domain-containing protein [Colwellia marinimaniae]|uniref:sulfotransferase family 2 domain-containing protein n=1 Tax=Colwellia marinimaniae TaxID=1513592 RepID=UPI00070C708F|nr:sulfotransferase family 2 domain-containing protein [Colwellia marinimaniae]